MPRKILLDAYCARNAGDDLFLKILLDRYPDTEFHLQRASGKYLRIFSANRNLRLYKERRPFRWLARVLPNLRYRGFDAALTIGGSLFIEGPHAASVFQRRLETLQRFRAQGKKSFLLGANFGPFQTSRFFEEHTRLIALYDDVCFRDRYSHALFERLPNVRVAPDIVFSLAAETPSPPAAIRRVGISAIDFALRENLAPHQEAYEKKLIELAGLYHARGAEITLFSFCESEGDARYAEHLARLIDAATGTLPGIEKYEEDLAPFLRAFRSMDAVIGTRFHAIILALVFGRNLIPIAYSAKTENALADLGLEDYCVPARALETAGAPELIERSARMRLANPEALRRDAESQFAALDAFLRG